MRLNWISLNKEIQWYRWLKQLILRCAHQHDEILSCDMGKPLCCEEWRKFRFLYRKLSYLGDVPPRRQQIVFFVNVV